MKKYDLYIIKSFLPEPIVIKGCRIKGIVAELKKVFKYDQMDIAKLKTELIKNQMVAAYYNYSGIEISVFVIESDKDFEFINIKEIIKKTEDVLMNSSYVLSIEFDSILSKRVYIDDKPEMIDVSDDELKGSKVLPEEDFRDMVERDKRNHIKYNLKIILSDGEFFEHKSMDLVQIIEVANIKSSYLTGEFVVYLLDQLKDLKPVGTEIVAGGVKDSKSFQIICTVAHSLFN